MAKPNLPKDVSGAAAQVLSPSGDGLELTTGAASVNGTLPTGAAEGEIIRIAATQDCYIKFSSTAAPTAAATDILMPAGVEYFVLPSGSAYAAALQVSTAGIVQFMECS
jgi:hypothetical protein